MNWWQGMLGLFTETSKSLKKSASPNLTPDWRIIENRWPSSGSCAKKRRLHFEKIKLGVTRIHGATTVEESWSLICLLSKDLSVMMSKMESTKVSLLRNSKKLGLSTHRWAKQGSRSVYITKSNERNSSSIVSWNARTRGVMFLQRTKK